MNLSYFAYQFIVNLVKNKQKRMMIQPWNQREFDYAEHLLKTTHTNSIIPNEKHSEESYLTMGEFILMELYRLGNVDEETMMVLKDIFIALVQSLSDFHPHLASSSPILH